MNPRKRIAFLVCIMTGAISLILSCTLWILYDVSLNSQKLRLRETVKSQARLIEAVARFDKAYNFNYKFGSTAATLRQIQDAHGKNLGYGKTGEFTLSRVEGDNIVFLLPHHPSSPDNPLSVPLNSKLAVPMSLALAGKSGTVIGLDFRGKMVLAAYEPIKELNLGIVAKIDLSELRQPFIRAATISILVAITCISVGSFFFFHITDPMIKKLTEEVQILTGLLPICASCKKIRDDHNNWSQIESYISKKSKASFSHTICPDCALIYYPELQLSTNGKEPSTEKNTLQQGDPAGATPLSSSP
ncbi:MAG: hypothetical protein OEV64_06500 [Desulfobulbaceae bacterium]|nr:hypothetical protein [Desulfobulbaceae bacterium]